MPCHGRAVRWGETSTHSPVSGLSLRCGYWLIRSIAARVWLRISVGVLTEPAPGARNDLLQIWKLWSPPKLFLNFLGACDQHCGIAGAARSFNRGNSMPGHTARSLDYFAHGEAQAITEVKNELWLAIQRFERQHVGGGKVRNVNVITNAGAVTCGVIGAKDRDIFALAQ